MLNLIFAVLNIKMELPSSSRIKSLYDCRDVSKYAGIHQSWNKTHENFSITQSESGKPDNVKNGTFCKS